MSNKDIVEKFWESMESNDFYAASQLLHDEYRVEWPQSGELILGRDNFAAINRQFPAQGQWRFTVDQIVSAEEMVVTDVTVTDGRRIDRAITFSTIRDGRIYKQVEFWPEPFEAPSWRAQWVEKSK